jgi:hypothetical protein
MGTFAFRLKAIPILFIVWTLSGCNFPGEGLIDRFSSSPSNPEQNSNSDIFGQVSPSPGVSAIPTATATPVILTPDAPSNSRSSSVTQNTAILQWDAPGNITTPVTYNIYRINSGSMVLVAQNISTLSYNLSGLSPGTSTTYVIQAISLGRTSSNSPPIVINTPMAIPAIPTGLAASAITANSITFTWSAVAGATSYKVSEATGKFSEVTSTSLSVTVSGLAASTAHSVRVRACNAENACSAVSPAISASTIAAVVPAPAIPSGLASSNIAQTSFTLSWSVVSGATSYKISEASAKFPEITTTTNSRNITGLLASNAYSVRVKSCNSANICSVNSGNLAVSTIAAPAPAIPSGLASSAVSQNSFTLSWTTVSGAINYKVSESTGKFSELTVTAASASVVGLNPSVNHIVRVRSCNSAGLCSVNSSDLTVRTLDPPAPAVPSGLVSSNIVQTSFTLSWSPVSGATNYKISEASTKFAEITATTNFQSITGLVANNAYSVRVKSCNSVGTCSNNSTNLAVSTLPNPTPSPSPSPSASSTPVVIPSPLTFSDGFPSDATDIKLTIPLKVFISKNPDQITIQLQGVTGITRTGAIQVFRKPKGTSDWGSSIGSIATNANSLTFAATRGVHYEIKVSGSLSSGSGLGYTSAGIEVESPGYRGKILLVIDNVTAPQIQTALTNFKNTLIADGWIPIEILVAPNDPASTVKAAIQSAYNTDSANVKSVLLIGRVPVAYSGNGAPDGHSDHVGVWPTDQYYGDLGTWPSGTGAITFTQYRNRASSQISRFSPNTAPSPLELEVGRIDMQALGTDLNNVTTFTESEIALISSYLNRSSDYKKGTVAINPNRAIINNTLYWALDNGIQGVFKSFSSHVGVENIEFTSSGSDYFVQQIGSTSNPIAQWVYGGGGSYFGMIGSNLDINQIAQSSYLNRGIFFRTFGSYFGDFDTKSNMLRALIAKGHGLASSYESSPVYTHFMNLGESMGYSMRRSINSMATQDCNVSNGQECIAEYNTAAIKINNSITSTIHYDAAYGYWGGAYMGIVTNLMGDPTLRIHSVKMPLNASTSQNSSGKVVVSWSAPSESSIVGYHIYKVNYSGSVVTGYTQLTTTPVPGTPFTTNQNYVAGEKYLIKTVKLQSNLSGDFFNHSVGTWITNN